ncbi:MAG: TonB family protein [Acidobacteriota bacterium]
MEEKTRSATSDHAPDYWIAEDGDPRLRWALVGAAALHALLLFAPIPQAAATDSAEEEKPKVFVVQPVRFKPPVVEAVREIPKKRVKKVFVPDPNPHDPEPLRQVVEIEPQLDLPESDIIFDIPSAPPPVEPAGILRVGGEIRRPAQRFAPSPRYSEIARKARIQGVVILRAVLDKQGRVTDVRILKDLPFGLGEAAAEAVARWEYEPATLRGKPVSVEMEISVHFSVQ